MNSWPMPILVLLMSLLCHLAFPADARADDPVVDLSGTWQFQLDPEDQGESNAWFDRELESSIDLPGTTSMAQVGTPLELKPEMTKRVLRGLHQTHEYIGAAWYQREIDVPESFNGKLVELVLERVIWQTDVWLDGEKIGSAKSLSTPQVFSMGQLSPGTHRLSLRVDNREIHKIGMSHAYSIETQSIWNGIVGDIELRSVEPIRISKIRVDRDGEQSLKVRLWAANDTDKPAEAKALIAISPGRGGKVLDAEHGWRIPVGGGLTEMAVALDRPLQSWSEFTPVLHDITVELRMGDVLSSKSQPFGLRTIEGGPMSMRLNGESIFLRGTLDNAAYPLTGHPPTNEAEWINIFTIAKRWGLNHIRYHSWCPPEAAFAAADKVGIYLQPELPYWGFDQLEEGGDLHQYLQAEGRRIFDAYGHHPSFVMFSLGNELYGPFDLLHEMVEEFRAYEDGVLITTTTFSFAKGHGQWPEPVDDFFLTQRARDGWVRGQGFFNEQVPGTIADYRESIVDFPVPLISHEIGQYPVYPQLSEIEKYSGVLDPTNFKAIRADLDRRGRLHMAETYTRASGKFAALLYKEEIERALRTPNLSGFQLLDLHDFPGQSTALVGVLDVFWDSKGLIEAEDWREFCGPVVPLLRVAERIYHAGDTINAAASVYHYGPSDLEAGKASWRVVTEDGVELDRGSIAYDTLAPGGLHELGSIVLDTMDWPTPKSVTVHLSLDDGAIRNEWRLWIYPENEPSDDAAVPNDVLIAYRLDDSVREHLAAGGRVLLNPPTRLLKDPQASNFTPVFWSPLHFENQPTTMGLLIQPSHRALAAFPTSFHSDWQWWDLTVNSAGMPIDSLENRVQPIVQYIDDFGGNRHIGAIWEARVGNGRLLVCTFDLATDLDNRPASKQLRRSLLDYVATSSFRPEANVSIGEIEALFRPPSSMAMAKVASVSSAQPGYEAESVLDGDPKTMWHTEWKSGDAQYPHELVIDLGRRTAIEAIVFKHRGDGNKNGRVRQFAVYLSDDPDSWGRPVMTAEFDPSMTEQAFELNGGDAETIYESVDAAARRYLRFVALSPHGNQPHASLTEIDIVGKPATDKLK